MMNVLEAINLSTEYLEKKGIDRLEDKVYNKIWGGKTSSSHGFMLNNIRHKDAIERAVKALSL